MSSYIVLGCGPKAMGKAIAAKLLSKDNSLVYITDKNVKNIDLTFEALKNMPHGQGSEAHTYQPMSAGLDVLKQRRELPLFFKSFDVVISALPAHLNPTVAEAVLKANEISRKSSMQKTHYCDLGGVLRITKKILSYKFSERAKELGISLVPENGFQPGAGNIHVVDMYHRFFDEGARMPLESATIYVGGLPKIYPYYKELFNLKGLEEIYYRRPLVISRGKLIKRRKLLASYEELNSSRFGLNFGEVGGVAMEAATTGGLGALPYYMEGHVMKLEEKTLRYKGHYEQIKNIKKVNFLPEMHGMLRKNPELKEDFCLMHIEMIGAGKVGSKKIKAERTIYVESDQNWNSMQKSTGFTTANIAILIAGGKAKPGAYPPEMALDTEEALKEINEDVPIIQEYHTFL